MEKKDNWLMQVYKHFCYKDGKFARHSFIMMTSWFMALGLAIADYANHGFNLTVWITFVCCASSLKYINALADKIGK